MKTPIMELAEPFMNIGLVGTLIVNISLLQSPIIAVCGICRWNINLNEIPLEIICVRFTVVLTTQ